MSKIVLSLLLIIYCNSSHGQDLGKKIAACVEKMSLPLQYVAITNNVEWTVTQGIASNGGLLIKFETSLGSASKIILVIGESCYEVFPSNNLYVDVGFKSAKTLDFAEKVAITIQEDQIKSIEDETPEGFWLSGSSEAFDFSLHVDSKTMLVSEKVLRNSQIEGSFSSIQYSEIRFLPSPGASGLAIPAGAKIRVARDTADLVEIEASLYSKPPRTTSRLERNPVTGLPVVKPPRGVSNAEFAKAVSERIRAMPPPPGVSREQLDDLATSWETNESLQQIPYGKDKGSWGVGGSSLILAGATGCGLVLIIAFLRARRGV